MSETKKMTNERPVYAFNRKIFCEGMRDGIPIALGYLAVSFSLGIAARNAGLTAFQGFLASLLNNASAGEYAAFTLIAANATSGNEVSGSVLVTPTTISRLTFFITIIRCSFHLTH